MDQIRYDFPVVTKVDFAQGPKVVDVQAAEAAPIPCVPMYQASTAKDDFSAGTPVGNLCQLDRRPKSGDPSTDHVRYEFRFDEGGNSVVAEGDLPQSQPSGGQWGLSIVQGPDRYVGHAVVLRTKNPKRWSIDGP